MVLLLPLVLFFSVVFTSVASADETVSQRFAAILQLSKQSQQQQEQGHYEQALRLNATARQQITTISQELQALPETPNRQDNLFSAKLYLANTYQSDAQAKAAQAMEARSQKHWEQAENLQEQAITHGQQAIAAQQQALALVKSLPNSAQLLPTLQTQIHAYEFMLASKLTDLGVIYHAQERNTDATRLLDESHRLLARLQAHIPPQDFTPILQALAMAYQEQGNSEQAQQLFQQSSDPTTAAGLDARLLQHLQAGEIDQALPLLHHMLALAQAEPDGNTGLAMEAKLHKLRLPMTLNGLGNAYLTLGKYPEAQQYFEQNLALTDNDLPPSHAGSRATSFNGLATLHRLSKHIPQALASIQQAYAEYDAYPAEFDREHAAAKQMTAITHLSILWSGLNAGQLQPEQALPEAFLAAQWIHGSARLEAFRQIALRLAADQPDTRTQLQTLWDKQTQLQALDKQYTTSLTNTTAQAATTSAGLQQAIQQTRQAIQQQ